MNNVPVKRFIPIMVVMWLFALVIPAMVCGLLAVAESLEDAGHNKLALLYVKWGCLAIACIWIFGCIVLINFGDAP